MTTMKDVYGDNKEIEVEIKKSMGIDRVVLAGFELKDINIEDLNNTLLDDDKKIEIGNNEFFDFGIESIDIINDDVFTYFSYKPKLFGKECMITINVCDDIKVLRNLNNYNVDDLKSHIYKKILPRLKDVYGIEIEVDEENVHVQSIELNTNLILPKAFCDYTYFLGLLRENASGFRDGDRTFTDGSFRKSEELRIMQDGETFGIEAKRGDGTRQLILYDKRTQFERASNGQSVIEKYGEKDEFAILRVEAKWFGKKIIQDNFCSRDKKQLYLEDLSDELIKKKMIKYGIAPILGALEKIKDEDKKKLEILYKEYFLGWRWKKIMNRIEELGTKKAFYVHTIAPLEQIIRKDEHYIKGNNCNKAISKLYKACGDNSYTKDILVFQEDMDFVESLLKEICELEGDNYYKEKILIRYNSFYYGNQN